MGKPLKMNRRTFIKGAAVTGAMVGLGGTVSDFQLDGLSNVSAKGETKVFQSGCGRNCYSTCSMLTTVEDGVVKFVEGNPANTYTNGTICSKGNVYPRHIYSPDRIKYPMRQTKKGSGEWKRISWDEALTEIAQKIIDIKKEYGSTLPIVYNKYSGNFNTLNYGVEGMWDSIGYHTLAKGTPCWPAGIDAQAFDFGTILNNDPEDFVNAKYMILWGANYAWTAMHTMRFVEEAKERGCKVIAIDPVLTATAAKADMHIAIKSSTDGALALGMAKYILDNNLHDRAWLEKNALGYQQFFDYLNKEVTLEWASEKTGIPVAIIEQIAYEYATTKPANICIGYGMQRHVNGGNNVRAIDALVAMTGNVGVSGGGANYAQLDSWIVKYSAWAFGKPESAGEGENRLVNMNNFAHDVQAAQDPPIKMMWLACRNSVQQDPDTADIKKAFEAMDLVVTCDLFMNETVKMSDIVLPVTTLFESPGINFSYWHYWMTLNEKAIEPMYEAKHDVEIAMALSAKLNELEPGSCTYPTDWTMDDFLKDEFTPDTYAAYGLKDWTDLKEGPKKMKGIEVAWKDGDFRTPSGKYEFYSETAVEYGHSPIPVYLEEMPAPANYPYRCISPHWKMGINSQFQNLDWMEALNADNFVEMHPDLAKKLGVKQGDEVTISNELGSATAPARLTETVPVDTVVVYEMWIKDSPFNINNTVKPIEADMGAFQTGMPGIAFHDNFVDVKKA